MGNSTQMKIGKLKKKESTKNRLKFGTQFTMSIVNQDSFPMWIFLLSFFLKFS